MAEYIHQNGLLFRNGKLVSMTYGREARVKETISIDNEDGYEGKVKLDFLGNSYPDVPEMKLLSYPDEFEGDEEGGFVSEGNWKDGDQFEVEYIVRTDMDNVKDNAFDTEGYIGMIDDDILKGVFSENYQEKSVEDLLQDFYDANFTFDSKVNLFKTFKKEKRGKCRHVAALFHKAMTDQGRSTRLMQGLTSATAIGNQHLSNGPGNFSPHSWVDDFEKDRHIEPTGMMRLLNDPSIASDMPGEIYFLNICKPKMSPSIINEQFGANNFDYSSNIIEYRKIG
ncbi:MAG: hypothetical protein ABEK36_02075 [Candidatus Aenigmatarchaeota archaeon]